MDGWVQLFWCDSFEKILLDWRWGANVGTPNQKQAASLESSGKHDRKLQQHQRVARMRKIVYWGSESLLQETFTWSDSKKWQVVLLPMWTSEVRLTPTLTWGCRLTGTSRFHRFALHEDLQRWLTDAGTGAAEHLRCFYLFVVLHERAEPPSLQLRLAVLTVSIRGQSPPSLVADGSGVCCWVGVCVDWQLQRWAPRRRGADSTRGKTPAAFWWEEVGEKWRSCWFFWFQQAAGTESLQLDGSSPLLHAEFDPFCVWVWSSSGNTKWTRWASPRGSSERLFTSARLHLQTPKWRKSN